MNRWSSIAFEDVVVPGPGGLKRGPFGGDIKKDSFVKNGYKVYEQRHAIYGDFNSGTYYIDEAKFNELRSFSVQPNDLLISCSGTMGCVAIVPTTATPGIINQALLRVRPDQGKVTSAFLKRLLETPDMQQKFFGSASGSAIKNIRPLEEIRRERIVLPPVREQRRIATILNAADALRVKSYAAIAKHDTLAQAIFVEMFVVLAAKEWPVKTISELSLDMRTGPFGSQLLHSEFVNKGISVLGIDNAVTNRFRWEKRRFITEQKYKNLKRYTVHPGDVLITIMATCGRCAVVPPDIGIAINTKHLCCITPDISQLLPEFLHAAFLQHPGILKQLGVQAKGAVMPGLNMGIIAAVTLPVPPLALQEKFRSRLVKLNSLRLQYEDQAQKAESLFTSLQHRAFQGEL